MTKPATSKDAINTLHMLSKTQRYFVEQLSELCVKQQAPAQFTTARWSRDQGEHGGGLRFEAPQNSLFNQASVNVSQIQFEDTPDKSFLSATALSTIIHPNNPCAPSIHIHVSLTELRSGKNYWRLMADLNPAIPCEADTAKFNNALKEVSGEYYEQATIQGDEYFYIPALQSHRGVSHFYLEAFNHQHRDGNEFAQQFIHVIINSYIDIFSHHLNVISSPTEAQKNAQLDYHTLYFYQVLTLDKGTTAGLLIHDQNDIGTLGSLPRFVNRQLLSEWAQKTATPRNELVDALVALLPNHNKVSEITIEVKKSIAQVIREHYKLHPL